MAGGFKLKLNSAGVVELLNSPGVAADLQRRANAIQAAMPEGEWTVGTFSTDRANATVRTSDKAAREAAAENPSAVVGAVNAGRT